MADAGRQSLSPESRLNFWLILPPAKVKVAMDLSHFFHPLDEESIKNARNASRDQIGSFIYQHFSGDPPTVGSGDVVLLGLKSSPKDDAPDWIRHFLYGLKSDTPKVRLVDAGDATLNKYDQASRDHLQQAFEYLLKQQACFLVMGGGQEITFLQYLATLQQYAAPRLVVVDAYADLAGNKSATLQPHTFISNILEESSGKPGDVSLVAYQYPLVGNKYLDELASYHYELFRLSEVRENISTVEPAIRASHMLSFDVGSVRQSDAPGSHHPLPSGLHAEEACRLARFAGLSPALQVLGFYEYNPAFDQHGQTAHLIAQAIWYFLEGYADRYQEHPILDEQAFYKYITTVTAKAYQLVFFKSKYTGRWWMELPPEQDQNSYGPIVPCAYEDYLAATWNNLPDRWLRYLQKDW